VVKERRNDDEDGRDLGDDGGNEEWIKRLENDQKILFMDPNDIRFCYFSVD
jgi:hypothetical protein